MELTPLLRNMTSYELVMYILVHSDDEMELHLATLLYKELTHE